MCKIIKVTFKGGKNEEKTLIVLMTLLMLAILPTKIALAETNQATKTRPITFDVGIYGYDDDAIYYSDYEYHLNGSDFPRYIQVTVNQKGSVYSGELKFTGKFKCHGSNCTGYYSGVLYYMGQ